jgi:hypothetical protein
MPRLVLNCERVDPVTHEVVGDIVMIGRASSNHIVIDDSTAPGQYALVLRVGDSYWLI